MKTIQLKNTQRMSGTLYPGILIVKKKRDLESNKAQFKTLDTWLKDELILSCLPNSPNKKPQNIPLNSVLTEQTATIPERGYQLLNGRGRIS
ncbi:MAG: hypothetical protein WC382_13395 [Methanoregulaceae archaeon]|jgi:hypothetical protein